MSLDRHLRTPLTVGLLALTGVIGLSGCVPTVEDASSDSGQSEETEAASSEETQAEETQAEETPSEEASDDASEEASEEASEKPSEGASEDTSEKPSGDASSKSKDAAPAGDLVDASKLSGEPIEVVEGEGDGTVEIPEHDEPLVVVFENTSKDEFSYLYGTADPGQSLDGAETGETVIFLLDPYGYNGGLDSNTKKWKMEGDASDTFKMSFYPLDSIPEVKDGQGSEAEGTGIFRWNLEDDGYYAVKHDGESNFIVHGESPEDNGETSQLAFNEIGAIDGGLEVEDGEYIITVDADGKWSFSPITEEDYEKNYEPVEE